MPLAEDPRRVARFLQHLGDGYLIGLHHRTAHIGIDDACAVVVPAGHERSACRGADGADVERLHGRRATRECIDVRRADDGVAGHTEIAVALVIGEDDDDVRRAALDGRHRRAAAEEHHCRQEQAASRVK